MEPMALGSPVQSPKNHPNYGQNSPFLPSYLMGEQQSVSTPRHTSMSPTKNRSGLFKSPPGFETPERGNRQKLLFPQSPFQQENANLSISKQAVSEKSGPPVQGLFDTLEARYKYVPPVCPNTSVDVTRIGTPTMNSTNYDTFQNSTYNNFEDPVVTTPNRNSFARQNLNESLANSSTWHQNQTVSSSGGPHSDTWVTVLGFPNATTNMILAHFGQCGNIIEKKFPSQGNWVHIRYSVRFEALKALSFNGKVLANCIMVGVLPYRPQEVANKENLTLGPDEINASYNTGSVVSPARTVRPLSQSFLSPMQNNTTIRDLTSPQNVPQKSTGFVTKAMEYVFGW